MLLWNHLKTDLDLFDVFMDADALGFVNIFFDYDVCVSYINLDWDHRLCHVSMI